MDISILRIARIVKEHGKYCVKSKSNSSWSGGCYKTKEEAKKRLQQVEMFKHKSSSEDSMIPPDVYEGLYIEQGKESIDGQGEDHDPPPAHPQFRWNSQELFAGIPLGKISMVSVTEGKEKQNTFPELNDFFIDQEESARQYEKERKRVTRENKVEGVSNSSKLATPYIQKQHKNKKDKNLDPERHEYEEKYVEKAKRSLDGYVENSSPVGRWGSINFKSIVNKMSSGVIYL